MSPLGPGNDNGPARLTRTRARQPIVVALVGARVDVAEWRRLGASGPAIGALDAGHARLEMLVPLPVARGLRDAVLGVRLPGGDGFERVQ